MDKLDFNQQVSLKDKTIVITGGSGFIGSSLAKSIAKKGGSLILLDKNSENLKKIKDELSSFKVNIDVFKIDLLNSKDLDLFQKKFKKFKKIDALINAAAFAMNSFRDNKKSFFEKFENYPRELWQEAINVNLTGTFLITQIVGKIMIKNGGGKIVNVASDVGVISPDHRIYEPNPNYNYEGVDFNTPTSYSVSKAGLISMTKYLATHWASYGINVNSVSPAGVFNNQDEKFVEQLSLRVPLGRMAHVHEIVMPIIFLCTEAASFITGENLMIDGGRTAW